MVPADIRIVVKGEYMSFEGVTPAGWEWILLYSTDERQHYSEVMLLQRKWEMQKAKLLVEVIY
jgi:hypothetical protein